MIYLLYVLLIYIGKHMTNPSQTFWLKKLWVKAELSQNKSIQRDIWHAMFNKIKDEYDFHGQPKMEPEWVSSKQKLREKKNIKSMRRQNRLKKLTIRNRLKKTCPKEILLLERLRILAEFCTVDSAVLCYPSGSFPPLVTKFEEMSDTW